ncbi:hypothetical protein V7S43_003301 [Phytophthora oleae]|uniref:TKL protein kinase n=1 Tax=Phytophthora oleae TaxID=2107226 RepID=A0ABD3G0A0_9STRA
MVKPNGACPEIFTNMNASCTCLDGVDDTVWEFRIRLEANENSTTAYSTSQSTSDTLEINAIQTLYVPETLQKLSIVGTSDSPLPIEFVPEYRNQAGHELPIARSLHLTSNLSTIEIAGIDMFTIVTDVSSFMPSSATSVTLRNCNITSFGFEFTAGMNNLTQLDLSGNNMASAYAGTGNSFSPIGAP